MKSRSGSDLGRWRSSSRKRRPQAASGWVERLTPLAAVREPFRACHRQLVQLVLERHLSRAGKVVEIGAGLGQLREWLPADFCERLVHTDPDTAALRELQARFPDAEVSPCGVERLPFENDSLSGVVALCVLDIVPDLQRALVEIQRVLAPGACLVHLLDLEPGLESVLREAAREGGVVLPNLFSDPSSTHFPEDLLISEREPLLQLLRALAARGQTVPDMFRSYLAAFGAEPFDSTRAARAYDSLSRTPEARELLRSLLSKAYALGYQLGLPPARGRLVSSGRHFSERIVESAGRVGLNVKEADVLTRSAYGSVSGHTGGAALAYRSLVLGHERRASEVPSRTLAQAPEGPPEGECLLEAGVHVFVATKATPGSGT